MASISAAFLLKVIFSPIMGGGVTVPSGSYGQAFSLEFIITFNLMFVVTAVSTDTRAVSSIFSVTPMCLHYCPIRRSVDLLFCTSRCTASVF